ncbi:MAG: DEAD/DEAH box helicase [Brumimicrobium sp.]
MTKKEWIQQLYKRINDYATFATINRSAVYTPTITSQEGRDFEFECQGSMEYPYHVSVWHLGRKSISSDCDCPYEGEGICKHQVASINLLVSLSKDGLLSFKDEVIEDSDSELTVIPCKDGVFITDELQKIQFRNSARYYNPLKIKEVKKDSITARFDDYMSFYTVKIIYNAQRDVAILNCTCKANYNCSHKHVFLTTFLERFNIDYFSLDYEKKQKEKILKEKNLLGKIDFDEALELVITPEGVKYREKLPNIKSAMSPINLFTDNRKDFFIPPSQSKEAAIGFGLCLGFHKKSLQNVYPFYGKLNKTKEKIASKLNEIYPETLTDALQKIKSPDDKKFVIEAVQLAESFDKAIHDQFTIEKVNAIWTQMNEILPLLQTIPVYKHKVEDTFVVKHLKPLSLSDKKFEPIIKITEAAKFYSLDFKIKIDDSLLGVKSKDINITPVGIIYKEQLYPFSSTEEGMHLMYASLEPKMHIVKDGLDQLRKNVIQPLSSVFDIEYKDLKEEKVKSKTNSNFEKQVYLTDEEGEYVVLQPLVKYGNYTVTPGSKEKVWKDAKSLTYIQRQPEEEAAFVQFIRGLHPSFEYKTDFFHLTPEDALKSMWLMETIDKLKEEKVRVFGLNDLKSIRYNLNKPSFSVSLNAKTDWFDMEIDVSFGDQKVDLKSIQKALVKQSNFVELKDGTIGILPQKWIDKYKKYFKLGQVKKDEIQISNYQFNIIDELYEEETNTPKFLEELYEKKKRLANLKELKAIQKPTGLKAELRPYQKEGLNWLVFLHENKLGGCLADDMGLGKTLQAIAFILYLKNKSKKKKQSPHLIVAPTSLIFNWMAEIEKFAPSLNALTYIGPNRREHNKELDSYDIILTTYGSIINDIEFHQKRAYNYVILDESQAIKNPQSQRFKAVRLLKCENRLALTGTPIENNTFDLYSQFNFLNPGIFGSVKHFKATFSDDIDKNQDQETSDLLARMIHPFLLRRTKDQVAKELPDKTEAVIYCDMDAEQRKVYDHFKQYFREKLMEQIENEGVNKSQMYILQGLTKLRQICNSTELADKKKDYGSSSAKLDELTRHLKDKVGNHKVLVFSQFVGMLSIIKKRLKEEKINFEYLDGQTKNREEKVNNFQNDDTIRVFLISLKAGGTGLNLTEADYVFLVDPWWNPAVENQAIDRCYRIGQSKKVMAYRMICKDTIEEKIVALQNKKKAVAADVIRVDKDKKTFNKKDVELFFGD